VIQSFKDEATEAIWEGQVARSLPTDIQRTARRKLRMLAAAQNVQDLKSPPGNHLEALKSDRKGQHSIRINGQWRICFVWKADGAHDVEIVDYH
jgi:proteic killer suppression protein